MPKNLARRAALAVSASVLALTAVGTPAAGAAESVTSNACYYAIDDYWRALDFRIAASAEPGYVQPGGGFRLKGAAVAAAFPDWIAEYGFNLGHLNVGKNAVKSHVWVAIDGKGSAQGTQVVKADVTAETTITATPDGQKFVSATPLAVAVSLPDTTWTAPTVDGAPVEFSEGRPGQLPAVPGYGGGPTIQPIGSIFIRAELSSSIAFDLDCLPGKPTSDYKAFVSGGAPKFEIAYADPSAPPSGIAAPPVRSPSATVVSKSLKVKAKKSTSVTLANQGLITAHGQVRIRTVERHKVGSGPKGKVDVAPWTTYELSAGSRTTLKLNLSSKAKRLLAASKRSVQVRVETRAATGVTDSAGKPAYAAPTFLDLRLKP